MSPMVKKKLFIRPTTLRDDDLLPYMSGSPIYQFEDNEKVLVREYETRPFYHSGDRIKPTIESDTLDSTSAAPNGITLVDKSVSIVSSKKETKLASWFTKIKKLLRIGKT